ncbi:MULTISPECIES: hypothetical protein [Buttiauxella]|uniref:hypothetical protein n=1 Tax=Buttiauxella TaxID=82976 RepID=UPI00155FA5AA|nr:MULTISPECIES: hypothetical protein [Buttiauxella]MCS3604878.1 hypothetical protein [Buttiauxella sp. BIGb0471]BCG11260.1 hypothetical protein BADSM9389_39710 [Buttiauxella agrestis]
MSELRPHKPKDYLLDEHTFSSFPSMNPAMRDMAVMNGSFITESHYIMLLTLDEAQNVVDELLGKVDYMFSYRAGLGNIKDGLDGFRTASKLMTYHNEFGKLVIRFQSLGIRALKCRLGGTDYIKLTGYPALRRVLNGTRYSLRNPQILEMGIGIRGLGTSIVKGTKFCICCSLAWRAVELIFKSHYDLVDFLVDVTMDVAKIIVSSVVLGVVGGIFVLLGAPVIITTFVVIGVGIILNAGLNILDDKVGLSVSLKEKIRIALAEEQRMKDWNQQHSSSFLNLLANTSD